MKIALITGASSGMGREFAVQISRLGEVDEVWLVARREERLKSLAETLPVKSRVFALDLTDCEAIPTLIAELEKENSEIKYLVLCAGYAKFGSYDQIADRDVSGMIDLNAKSLAVLTQKTVTYMRKGDHIIHLASISAYMPVENLAIYGATKAFVLSYSRALGAELKPRKISVTAVCPGWTDTEFFDSANNGENAKGPKKFKPMSRTDKVVKKALKSARKGKSVSIYGAYWKMMHVVNKIFPKKFAMAIWHKMQKR